MSILPEAHDFVIQHGDFRTLNRYNHYGSSGIDILPEASAPEAAADAEERSFAPSCFPGTREQYIEDITNWAIAGSDDHILPLYWLKGPAGVGKSGIAQTCAEKLKDAGLLGASFFFSVSGRCKDHTRFFPTVAHQLSTIHSDYREIVNRKASNDKTLVKKKMVYQFKSLIVEPLQELKRRGKEIERKTVFIDGLDECESPIAQLDIIEIIASSIRAGSTPFRWAIFSREEPFIVSAFSTTHVSSYYHSVLLPISRDVDREIELYLRAGFENILRRRNLLHLSLSWPTAGDIGRLVDAAAGLFAHPATILRFIDNYTYSGFMETLQAVLNSTITPANTPTSPFTDLDNLYILIMKRVPADVLPSMYLLLSYITATPVGQYDHTQNRSWYVTTICNALGISETVFRSICNHLQAVVAFQAPSPQVVDLVRSRYDQDPLFQPHSSVLRRAHGSFSFYHKSFYDFLIDPARSSNFCVKTLAIHQKQFDRLVSQQLHYSSSYVIQGSSASIFNLLTQVLTAVSQN